MIPPRAQRTWLTTKEAAAYLGVSRQFMIRKRDTLKPDYEVGNRYRYEIAGLNRWLETQRYDGRRLRKSSGLTVAPPT